MTYEMDPAEKVRTEEKARSDAAAGKYDQPFILINGSALDKARKTEYNSVYVAAHGVGAAVKATDDAGAKETAEVAAEDDIVAKYEAKFGKKPHWKMRPETMQAAIDGIDEEK